GAGAGQVHQEGRKAIERARQDALLARAQSRLTRHPMPAHRFTFYLPSLSPDLRELLIEGDEHHHLARVLRLAPGQTIAATNGRGLLVEGELVAVGKTRT